MNKNDFKMLNDIKCYFSRASLSEPIDDRNTREDILSKDDIEKEEILEKSRKRALLKLVFEASDKMLAPRQKEIFDLTNKTFE